MNRKGPYKLNEFGVFEQPEEIEIDLPKTGDARLVIEVAAHKGHWHVGYTFDLFNLTAESMTVPPKSDRHSMSSKTKRGAIMLALSACIQQAERATTGSARHGVQLRKVITRLYEHKNQYEAPEATMPPITLDATDVSLDTQPESASPKSLLEILDNLLFDIELEGDMTHRSSKLAWEMGHTAWIKGYRDTETIARLADSSPMIAAEPADFLRGWLTASNDHFEIDPDEGFPSESSTEAPPATEGLLINGHENPTPALDTAQEATAAGESAAKATEAISKGGSDAPPPFVNHVKRQLVAAHAARFHAEAVQAAQDEFCRTGLQVAALASELKVARKHHAAAANELIRLQAHGPEHLPLFDREPTTPNTPAPETEVDPPAPLTESAEAPSDWKTLVIESLKSHGLSPAIVGKLIENGVTTLGEFDHQRTYKSIGPAKREKIADAFESFWKAHPEFCRAEESPGTEGDSDEHGSEEA